MNLYKVNIHAGAITGIYGESFHVQAGNAKTALDRAYKKFEKQYPGKETKVVHNLELIEENW